MRGFKNKTLNVLSKVLAVVAAAMIAAVMLAGCGLVDEDSSDCNSGSAGSGSGSAIGFGVTAADSTTTTRTMTGAGLSATALTRTPEGTMTLDGSGGTESLRERGFGVFACHTGVHPYVSTSTTANLMWNQPVDYNGTTGQWEYSPLVYWPNGDDEVPEYVSFFAYAPHSDRANGCIADMSNAEDVGDPWILYQLAGKSQADGNDGWKACQVDLVYDFKKDQRRTYPIASNKIDLDFKHALACVGDQVTLSCDESVTKRLKGLYTTSPVSLTVSTVTVDYQLTRKGRLILNSNGQPNWQAVESEDAKVHRYLTFTPDMVIAQATSSSACTTSTFSSGSGNGIFYIPVEAGSMHQQATVSIAYAITSADPTEDIDEGTVTATVDLSYVSNASEGRDLSITLSIPDMACSGQPLSSAVVGQIICSHGKVHAATVEELACGGKKVAVVAYAGSESGEGGYHHGLAIALKDADDAAWCNQTASTCLSHLAEDYASAIVSNDGLSATTELVGQATHAAAANARNFMYDGSVAAGVHPAGTSQWFLPALGQWNLMVKAMTGGLADVSQSGNDGHKAAGFNGLITAAGGTGVQAEHYWSATESSASNAWYMSFKDGKTNSTDKTSVGCVRPVLAF